jgi:hypothetical protein
MAIAGVVLGWVGAGIFRIGAVVVATRGVQLSSAVIGTPARAFTSRARCAWSAYPVE